LFKEGRHTSYIVKEGTPFILSLLVLAILTLLSGLEIVSILFFFITLFVTWFFRNPEREPPKPDTLVVSPADGKVIKIEEAYCEEIPGQVLHKISIFMSLFNVHVNRIPCSGQIQSIRYREGKFFPANLDKASEFNERNTIVIGRTDGRKVVTIQIAGVVARRIVWWIKENSTVQIGQRFGMIRFGSRLEVFIPREAKILVKIGDQVKAGQTPLGEL